MKLSKLDLMIYIYSGKLTNIAYYMATLIIIIPICIVLVTDTTVDSSFSKILIGISGLFIIIGKFLVVINKKKEKKNISIDMGILTGIILALINYILISN